MGIPLRSQGVAGGLAGLVVGPIVALLAAHGGHSVPEAVAAAPARTEAAHVVTVQHLLPPRFERAALPAQAAVPVAAPVAAPAAVPPAPPPPAPTLRPAVVAPIQLPVPSAGSIQAIIKAAADAHGVSYSWMLKIAMCESSLNPNAVNPRGPYIGLFQFAPSTFRAHGGTNIYDPVQQSNIAADMLTHGQARAWACA